MNICVAETSLYRDIQERRQDCLQSGANCLYVKWLDFAVASANRGSSVVAI